MCQAAAGMRHFHPGQESWVTSGVWCSNLVVAQAVDVLSIHLQTAVLGLELMWCVVVHHSRQTAWPGSVLG